VLNKFGIDAAGCPPQVEVGLGTAWLDPGSRFGAADGRTVDL